MSQKRIIIISALNLWSMESGRGAPSFYNTVEGYVNSGWDTYLINTETANNDKNGLNGLKKIGVKYLLPKQNIKKLGFFIRLINMAALKHSFCREMEKIINKTGKEKLIIYAYEIAGVKAAKKICRKYNLPLVTRFQGTIITNIPITFINRLRHTPHFSALAEKADMVIMTDDGTGGDRALKNLHNKSEKIFFWRNGVDEALLNSSESSDRAEINGVDDATKVLMTLSRVVSWKRIDRAINAFARVAEDRENVKLVIVGDGDARPMLEDLAKKLGVFDKVIFTGSVSHEQVHSYIKRADVFLSLYDLSNVGNPLLEAMMCGKPIITLDVGDTANVINDGVTGILISPSQLEKIPENINKLLDDSEYADMLGQNAQKFAKDNFWSWKQRIDCELKETEKLLNSK